MRKRGNSPNRPEVSQREAATNRNEKRMMSPKWALSLALLLTSIVAVVLWTKEVKSDGNAFDLNTINIEDTPAFQDHGFPGRKSKVAQLDDMLKSERSICNLHTDKEVYRPGDKVFARCVLTGALDQQANLSVGFILLGLTLERPDGSKMEVQGFESVGRDISWQFSSFTLAPDSPGGIYTLYTSDSKYGGRSIAPGVRKFEVRISSSKNKDLSMDLEFERKSYEPGEKVVAFLSNTKRLATGTFAQNARLTAVAKFGREVFFQSESDELHVDKEGGCRIEFTLPKEISPETSANLVVSVRDGSLLESIAKTIPLVLVSLSVEILPESGDLIEGLMNRVYLQANSLTTGDPADIDGEIMQQVGTSIERVATVSTSHEGRGRSTFFKVKRGAHYFLKVNKPSTVTERFPLPKARELGSNDGLLSLPDGGVVSKSTVQVVVRGTGEVHVGLYKRNKLLDVVSLKNLNSDTPRAAELEAPNSGEGEGVLRLTLYAGAGEGSTKEKVPLAERLVFRKPSRTVETKVRCVKGCDADGKSSPRTSLTFEVETFLRFLDGKTKPVQAAVGIGATDLARLSLIENRRHTPRLPASVYLEPEIGDVFDSGAYFNSPDNLDLLLGTAGWRRFAFAKAANITKAEKGGKKEKLFLRLFGVGMFERKVYNENHFMQRNKHAPVMMMAAMQAPDQAMEAAAFGGAPADDEGINDEEEDAVDGADVLFDAEPSPPGDDILPNDVMADFNEDQRVRPKKMGRPAPMDYTRVYSHKARAITGNHLRQDFAETLFWNVVKTKSQGNGRFSEEFSFDLSDSITSFRVFLDVTDGNGAFGSHVVDISSALLMSVDVKLPVEVLSGDQLLLPLTIQTTSRSVKEVELKVGMKSTQGSNGRLALKFKQDKLKKSKLVLVKDGEGSEKGNVLKGSLSMRNGNEGGIRTLVPMESLIRNKGVLVGESEIELYVSATPNYDHSLRGKGPTEYTDRVVRKTKLRMQGFPERNGTSGRLKLGEERSWSIQLPADTVLGSVSVEVRAYLSPVNQLIDVIAALIREPFGCFEQTSSTTYPMVLALRYLVELKSNDPKVLELIEHAKELIKNGYQKLASFESKSGGFEWFGNDPGHEALTAYGVIQFAEMSREELELPGMVDSDMLERTKSWLLGRRDGKGGFKRSESALDSFGRAPSSTTNAYIMWSLAKSGLVPWSFLEKELAYLLGKIDSKDPYVVALTAAILKSFERDEAKRLSLLDSLASMQNPETGCIFESGSGGVIFETITMSGGLSKGLEGTAMAILAWIGEGDVEKYFSKIAKGIECVTSSSKDGTFGSTQSTALSLQAIIEYNQLVHAMTIPSTLALSVLDASSNIPLEKESSFEITPESLDTFLVTMDSVKSFAPSRKVSLKLALKKSGKGTSDRESDFAVPYSIQVSFHRTRPPSSSAAKVSLSVELASSTVAESQIIEMTVLVANKNTTASVPMTIAKIGIPAGTEPRFDKLRELSASGSVAHFETFPNFVVLYWYGLNAGEQKKIVLELEASVCGTFQAPSSSAYLYYENEHKAWSEGQTLTIEPF